MGKQTAKKKSELQPPNDELQAIWDRLPDLKEVYQVGTCYFTELHYAESYANSIHKALQTHYRDEQAKGE